MDIVDQKTRSRMMSGIKGKNTRPEIFLRRFLHTRGFRFRLHVSGLPGKPDIVLPKYKLCIFVHGCFWHRHEGCKLATTPQTHTEFWLKKFASNKKHDEQVKIQLRNSGWRVFEIWECGLKKQSHEAIEWLPACIKGKMSSLSWPDL